MLRAHRAPRIPAFYSYRCWSGSSIVRPPPPQKIISLNLSSTSVCLSSPLTPHRLPPAQVRKWSSSHVARFLESHGFGAYARTFRQQHVMGAALAAMRDDDLITLGIDDPLERHRLLTLVRAEAETAAAAAAAVAQEQQQQQPREGVCLCLCDCVC